MQPLTERQQQVYDWIIRHFVRYHCQPTYREIGLAMSITSKTGVRNHLEAIAAKGYIKLRGGLGRERARTRAAIQFLKVTFTPVQIGCSGCPLSEVAGKR